MMTGRVNSHNEWDPLREIIVGSAEGAHAVLTWPRPAPLPPPVAREAYALASQAYPQWLIDEIREDLDDLAGTLSRLGATVHRPTPQPLARMFSTPDWQSTGTSAYNVRDLHLVVGNTVIESPSHVRSRYFESFALHDIWYHYLEHGFRWIAAPKPRLDQPVLEAYHQGEGDRPLTAEDLRHSQLTGGRIETLHRLTNREILFEAANTLRMGRDLLYLASVSGNAKGAAWLQSVLGDEYRVHTTEAIYRSSHIDSTVIALRPGLVMLNAARVGPENCPGLFDRWEKIAFSDVAPTPQAELDFQANVRDPLARRLEALGFLTDLGDMSSPWVGMNLLSVSPDTVLVEERQTNLRRVLEAHRFTVIPVRMRHMYTQAGGIHCATLDTVRDGSLESYFS